MKICLHACPSVKSDIRFKVTVMKVQNVPSIVLPPDFTPLLGYMQYLHPFNKNYRFYLSALFTVAIMTLQLSPQIEFRAIKRQIEELTVRN